ncbi:uncharacterized protein LOC129321421 isoform X2 [Prosopis cineraria]|uniref:uncharacterized protein LOC129321421 isoform X2 n=1 Tax=Prosopis cineraria TaxID=364024 RepID=UPI0024101127|nr:uncharacterized protein LOC129321421 isoform X2 [Prosopis cineraria]
MEPCTYKASHSDHRKREKASKKKAEARKKEAFHGNSGFGGGGHGQGYYGPFHSGYGYGYGYPYRFPDGYYPYVYGRPERFRYDDYVARAPLSYRDGFNHCGNLHFGDTDPYRCYQSFYETPLASFPQAPPPRQLHPFYTPETVCSIM